jgi:hypothetical protein
MLAAGVLALSGCAQAEPDPNASVEVSASDLLPKVASSLTGTSWRLLGYDSFESGSERDSPAPGEIHSITFAPGGRLTVRLACNPGSGSWVASQSDPYRGSLGIGPLQVARTPCVGARMDRVEQDLEHVGSYVIGADGRLTLNLRADSGNLVWERVK